MPDDDIDLPLPPGNDDEVVAMIPAEVLAIVCSGEGSVCNGTEHLHRIVFTIQGEHGERINLWSWPGDYN